MFSFGSAAFAEDLLLINGDVYTPQGWVQAVAIQDGKISAVGTTAELRKKAPSGARIIDLKGQTVFPGLHDMHVHPMMAGQSLESCKFAHGGTIEDIKSAVKACVAKRKPGEWITGGQWQAGSLTPAELNKKTLDEIAPDNPVLLSDISMHSVWVNSKALELANITRDTPNPDGGIIERDANGDATGVLRERATHMAREAVPEPDTAKAAQLIKTALDELVSFGVTSLVDAGVRPNMLDAYLKLADDQGITPRVRGCYNLQLGYTRINDEIPDLSKATRPNLKLDCIKIFMDGVPTDSHTAAMLEPYVGAKADDPNKPERGLLFLPPADLNQYVTRLDKQGYVIKFHAAGDRSARTAMDAVEAARKANGMNDQRHDVGHLTFITEEDLQRAQGLNATLEFSPYFWYPSPITHDIVRATGEERNKRAWPIRDGIDSKALVVVGSDWSVVDSPDPWIAIESMVTRRAPGAKPDGEAYAPQQAVTLSEAIDIFTINSAKQLGAEKTNGSIEVGKIADLVIVDRNPFKIPADQIHKTTTVTTIIDGKVVYEARPKK